MIVLSLNIIILDSAINDSSEHLENALLIILRKNAARMSKSWVHWSQNLERTHHRFGPYQADQKLGNMFPSSPQGWKSEVESIRWLGSQWVGQMCLPFDWRRKGVIPDDFPEVAFGRVRKGSQSDGAVVTAHFRVYMCAGTELRLEVCRCEKEVYDSGVLLLLLRGPWSSGKEGYGANVLDTPQVMGN